MSCSSSSSQVSVDSSRLITASWGFFQLLEESNVSRNVVDGAGKTAVQLAAEFGHEECVQLLIDHGNRPAASLTQCDDFVDHLLNLSKYVLCFRDRPGCDGRPRPNCAQGGF